MTQSIPEIQPTLLTHKVKRPQSDYTKPMVPESTSTLKRQAQIIYELYNRSVDDLPLKSTQAQRVPATPSTKQVAFSTKKVEEKQVQLLKMTHTEDQTVKKAEDVSKLDSQGRLSPPSNSAPRCASPQRAPERQIKYLGLIIEKDQEYEEDSCDNTVRQYLPIRDKYISIVKDCRKLVQESYEKRGSKEFRSTSKSLRRIARALRH